MAKPKEVTENHTPIKRRRGSVISFFRETVHETKRVRWPRRKEVVNYTVAALLTCFLMAILVWAFDLGVSKLLSLIGVV